MANHVTLDSATSRPTPENLDGDVATLFKRYYSALYAFFLRRTSHAADAEDLAQDVFIRLSRLDPALELRDAERFLFRIAKNLLSDRARRYRVRRSILESLPASGDAIDMEPDAERILQAKSELSEVMGLLNSLSDRTRSIFILRRFEQMKCQEIATCYGISVNAVEQHIRKALAHLSKSLGKQ